MDGNSLTLNGNPVTEWVTDPASDQVSNPEETISPKAAGLIYGCTKNNIVNHITGRSKPILKAIRGNQNEWIIKRRDFDEWLKEKGRKPSPARSDHVSKAKVTPAVPASVTPSVEGEGIYTVRIEGLEARLADAHSTIDDLRSRLDQQATAHKEALGAAETRHLEALSAETARREAAEARVVAVLEDKAASAEKAGELKGQVGELKDRLKEAQERAKEAEDALQRAKAPETNPRPSGGLVARAWKAVIGG